MSAARTTPARTLMVQGTASSVGKSLIVAALCRIFHREGLSVAPFKAQNMALNSFVTPDGGEIGRAQAVQAEAAGIEPSVEMNPILLKPEGGMRSQVVVLGKPLRRMTWSEYQQLKPEFVRIIADSLHSLRAKHDLIIIEGAGSPAEVNLAAQDIVNMHVAAEADAPVLLVGDIDRGGVFAHLVGTMELLAPADRERVAGFLINKFRGDPGLLKPGIEYLEHRFAIPVIGVVPYIPRLRIADEDSVALEDRRGRTRNTAPPGRYRSDTAAAHLELRRLSRPRTRTRRGCAFRRVALGDGARRPRDDSGFEEHGRRPRLDSRSGFARVIVERAASGGPIVGICGGCQMLGETIADPNAIESSIRNTKGLNLLPIGTSFVREKRTAQVRARVATPTLLSGETTIEGEISGYEIHMGQIERSAGAAAPFRIVARNTVTDDTLDGAISADGTIVGTMLHGIFENDVLRTALIRTLRQRKGIDAPDGPPVRTREAEYDRLAATVRANIDWKTIERIAGLS